jgi:type II secretory pathway pseudopilin PulG
LLELLVVIAILAGLIAVVLPEFSQLFARARFSFERSDIEQQLLELPQTIRQRGRGGVLLDPSQQQLPSDTAPSVALVKDWEILRLKLPEGWAIRVPKPVFYRFTGACTGGTVDLSLSSAVFRYTLSPPLCRPQLAETDAR